ncbi:MAG TPA: tetratricopeptide repeat protein [Burkholderiales bacterium]|nr:tetratricopeptide repeat protein [Burkholderiales bacterium]
MSNPIEEKLQQAHNHFSARDLAGAERLCNEILSGTPQHPDALHLLGVVRLVSGNAAAAAGLIGKALEGKPRDASLLETLGVARLAQGDGAAAETSFRKSIASGADSGLIHMRLGMALGAQGRFTEAENAMRTAAERAPSDSDVHVNLGNVLAAQGRAEEALASFRRGLALRPDNIDAQYNIGTLLKGLGRNEEAVTAYNSVLKLDPGNPDTLNNLGTVHEQLGRVDEAAECYRKALARDPRHVHARNNLGNALRLQGKLAEAGENCEMALAISPDFVDAVINLGTVRVDQGRLRDAQSLYERALTIDPRNTADAHRNLGTLFRSEGRNKEAIASYRRAIEAAPGQAAVHVDLGNALRDGGEFESAVTAFQRAIEIDPQLANAHFNLAETLKVLGRFDEAIFTYERTLAIRPDDTQALNGLIHVRQHMCDWNGLDALWERLRRAVNGKSGSEVSPFSILSMPTTAAEQLACTTAWARKHVEPFAAARSSLGFDLSKPHAEDRPKLRIGYLSWGFHKHATSYWAAEVLELHDRSRHEIFCYGYGPDDRSEIRARIRNGCDRFVDIAGETHMAAARRIHDDGVDVLVDLTGYTLGARTQIAALRPAPVQVSWFYPGTMGSSSMDYFIADPYVVPPELERYFAEKIVRLPDCYMSTDRRREVSNRVPTREACGLPSEGIVFCCFNQAYKILPDVFALWMRILRAVPGSVLWLAEANRWQIESLRREAVASGVAGERLLFAARQPLADYMIQYRLADLAIDTFPYTSHTTAADALWMGCPLVTCTGETFASRVAGSVLINAGMRELIVDNFDDYERKVVELAATPGRLQELRRRLQETRDSCPLFDTPRFVKNLERAYQGMFDAYIAKK